MTEACPSCGYPPEGSFEAEVVGRQLMSIRAHLCTSEFHEGRRESIYEWGMKNAKSFGMSGEEMVFAIAEFVLRRLTRRTK